MEIRPLVPPLVDDFLSLFDAAFSDNPYWMGCYCAYYDDPCSDDQWKAGADAAPAHREARCERIRAGQSKGLLAYVDGSVVGWCNVGPRDAFVNLRAYAEAVEPGDAPTGSVMCFVVHPEHRHRGVATALLERADDYLRDLGMATVEGYPRAAPPSDPAFPWSAASYKGTREMYEQAGYHLHRELDRFLVMRKDL